MRTRPVKSAPRITTHRVVLGLFVILLVLLALMGGYSRYGTNALTALRPLLVLITTTLLILPAGDMSRTTRTPALLLAGLAIVVALQLVPLPPAIWTALPERAGYEQAAEWIGQAQPWRPLTLVPVLTWNSLLALLPAAAMLTAIGRLDQADLHFAIPALLILGIASVLLGVLQIATGVGYLYPNPSIGLPTGFFSNRNHQAAFLASLLPLLAIWVAYPVRRLPLAARRIAAGACAMLFVVTVLITGSRTGLLLTALNLVGAGWLTLRALASGQRRQMALPIVALTGVLALLVTAAVYLGRGGGITRFASLDAGAEMRVRAWPVLRELVTTYLPWGSGFGTFDPLFRIHEPDALLKPSYFNNAHNDLLELAITGGAPALLLLAVLVGWISWRVAHAGFGWRQGGLGRSRLMPLAAAMMVMTWLIASLSDYPLRTPLGSSLLAWACCLLATSGKVSDVDSL